MFDVNLVESCSVGSEIADEWVEFHLVLHPDLAAAANWFLKSINQILLLKKAHIKFQSLIPSRLSLLFLPSKDKRIVNRSKTWQFPGGCRTTSRTSGLDEIILEQMIIGWALREIPSTIYSIVPSWCCENINCQIEAHLLKKTMACSCLNSQRLEIILLILSPWHKTHDPTIQQKIISRQ